MNALQSLMLMLAVGPAKADRINLADFGQVVQFTGDAEGIPETQPIERGLDGWPAYREEDGPYMIGVQWDRPRDVAEVNIEFRHAIANREKIKVQYFRYHAPKAGQSDAGNWVTAKVAEWWAGDRDISFTFTPLAEEQPGAEESPVTYRRTLRLRFLLGKDDLPPVRYIRAYGPNPSAEGIFDVEFPENNHPAPPYRVSVIDGLLREGADSGKPTTTKPVEFERGPLSIRVVYAQTDAEALARTRVIVHKLLDSEEIVSFLPVEVAKAGQLTFDRGVIVRHRKLDSLATHPSEPDADVESD